jgi:hypothetical protein
VLEFDHLPFGVADVEAIRADLETLGFTATATGVCRWTLRARAHAARALSIVFERGYLDLVEIQDPVREERLRASPLYAKGSAPSGLVLACASVEESRAMLAAKGIAMSDSYEIVRELPGADPCEVRYQTFFLREANLPFAFIADSAPGAMRTERWLAHANTATAIRCLHVRVPSLDAWLARSAAVFGGGTGATTAEFNLLSTTLVIHEEPTDAFLAAVARFVPQDRTALLAVEFSVADLDTTRTLLRRGQVRSFDLAGGIAVEPSAGYGCGLVFSDAGRARRCCG